MPNPMNVNCPTCGKSIIYSTENQHRPFCSERCKLIDLGAWAEEKYSIPDNSKSVEIQDFTGLYDRLNDTPD